MTFPVSGVDVPLWIPPAVAFVISFFTSMGGVSGAFLLLPFQMSFLHFTSPAVSPTNLVFNIVAIPSGVYRFFREGRMVWPLTWVICIGTLPGVVLGGILRIRYLPDPRAFKFFVGCVLLYLGGRLLLEFLGWSRREGTANTALQNKIKQRVEMLRHEKRDRLAAGIPKDAVVRTIRASFNRIEYEFYGERFSFSTLGVFALAFIVGIVGGTYGIGGGAIIAPFLVAVFELPVYTISGAALMGTLLTSIAGVAWYEWLATLHAPAGMAVGPDWALGALFGIGGFAGIYCGARLQKYVPARWIRLLLSLLVTFVAIRYVWKFFFH